MTFTLRPLPCNYYCLLQIAFLWPPYVIGQAIIFLPCGFFFFLLSFFRSEIGCLPYLHTWCGRAYLSAGPKPAASGSLQMQDAKYRQKSPSGHHRAILSGRGQLPYQVASSSLQPFGHNRHEPKTGGCVPFRGGAATPSNTTSPGPTFTSVPSGITIDMGQRLGRVGVPFFLG